MIGYMDSFSIYGIGGTSPGFYGGGVLFFSGTSTNTILILPSTGSNCPDVGGDF